MKGALIKTRLLSFAYEAGTLLLLGVVSALSSADFRVLVGEHAGKGFFGTVAVLVLMEVVKHLRNLKVLKNRKLGAAKEDVEPEPFVLI